MLVITGAFVYRQPGPTTGQSSSGTNFNYDPNAGTINIGLTTVGDTYSVWYLVHPGDIFDAATIAANDFTEIPFTPNTPISVGTSDFYLAATVGSGSLNTTFGYGWIDLHKQADGTLVALDNAVDYGPGIIVGTLTEVPEPSSSFSSCWLLPVCCGEPVII